MHYVLNWPCRKTPDRRESRLLKKKFYFCYDFEIFAIILAAVKPIHHPSERLFLLHSCLV